MVVSILLVCIKVTIGLCSLVGVQKMTISPTLFLNAELSVLSKYPTLRLQSIQDTNSAWWAEDRREVGVQAPSEVGGTWMIPQ